MMQTDRAPPTYAFRADQSGFDAPGDPAIPLWRYMDFTKFMSVLDSQALFFCRTDLLGDPWEGSLTRVEAEDRKAMEAGNGPLRLHGTTQAKILSEVTNAIVSCWHMNEVESMAMWRLYLTGTEGVAIRSTYQRLADCFPQYDGTWKGRNEDQTEKELLIHIGVVNYIDYESPGPAAGRACLRKRKSFEHEREIRAVAMDTTWGSSPAFDAEGRPLTRFEAGGDYVPVDLSTLVESIYVSPEAAQWFVDLVASAVGRFGLNCPVRQSDLARDPVF